MKRLVESDGFNVWLKVTNALVLPVLLAFYAWLKQDLAETFVTRQEIKAIEQQRDLQTQVALAEMASRMALLGQSVASLEKTIERRMNP